MYTLHANHIERDGAIIPLDESNADYRNYLAWREEGNTPAEPSGPSFEERAAVLLLVVDAHLNAAARAHGYDSILSAALRAALPASPFHAQGLAFGHWMDAVYAKCYEVLGQVQGEEIAEPNQEELIAMLPVLMLPA
ncbi:hypothetical protein D3C87_1542450 [compost metagenome]